MTEPKQRKECPICGEASSKFICRLGEEYLETGSNGWQYSPDRNRTAGLDFRTNPDIGVDYRECSKCGTFYLDAIYPVEDMFAIFQSQVPMSEKYSVENPANSIKSIIKGRVHIDSALILMALDSTKSTDPQVLDYGCGGGRDLSIFNSIGVRKPVGYNIRGFMFPGIRHYMQSEIRLVDNRDALDGLGPFDAVRCNSVLEHVEHPNAVVADVYDLLKPGGIAYFSAPMLSRSKMLASAQDVASGIKVKNLHEGHLQIWNRDSLPMSKYIEDKGFEIIPLIGGTGHYDVRKPKKALRFFAEHGFRMKQILTGSMLTNANRFNHWAFFARKPS